jgi:Fur family zinc uptake transcriptional regulator
MGIETQREIALDHAKALVAIHDRKLTDKRSKVMAVLLDAEKPLSAYGLTDLLNVVYEEHVIANSVYRILDWLVAENLAHRLDSINKFVACQNQHCRNSHSFSIFIICKVCETTSESYATQSLQKELSQRISDSMYSEIVPHLELRGVCGKCSLSHQKKEVRHA